MTEPDGDRPAGLGVRLVDRTVVVAAPPERVYALLTHAHGIVRWMAPQARVEAVVDGVITWRHANGDRVEGRFVELVPARRVVFTYGWDLVHRGLSDPTPRAHHGGWANYLARLAAVAEGRDPGPHPLAAERVPAAGQPVEP